MKKIKNYQLAEFQSRTPKNHLFDVSYIEMRNMTWAFFCPPTSSMTSSNRLVLMKEIFFHNEY